MVNEDPHLQVSPGPENQENIHEAKRGKIHYISCLQGKNPENVAMFLIIGEFPISRYL
jgi:hypothetical protein